MRIAWKPLGWGLFAVVALAVLVGIVTARHLWSQMLEQNGIETLEWQGLDFSFSGVSVRELKLNQSLPARDLVLHGQNLSLGWRWPEWGSGWQPQLTRLTASYLELDLDAKPVEQTEPQPSSQWQAELLAWLPEEVGVQKFEVTLPCETGHCSLEGGLTIASSRSIPASDAGPDIPSLVAASGRLPVKANVQLDHKGHQLGVSAILDSSGRDNLNVSADVSIDGKEYLTAFSDYSARNTKGLASWSGSIKVPDLPQTDWLLAWLQTWQTIPIEQWPDQPDTGSLAASWNLLGPGDTSFLSSATGSVNVHALLPQPWPAPGIGSISGNAEIAMKLNEGDWQPETMQADLELRHPASWIKKISELMRPEYLKLSVRPAQAIAARPSLPPAAQIDPEQPLLPLKLELTSRGGANISIRSHLALATSPPWRAHLGNTQLTAALTQLEMAGWRMAKPTAKATFTGWLDTSAAMLKFTEPTLLEAEKLEPVSGTAPADSLLLSGLRVSFSGATLSAGYRQKQGRLNQFSLTGPVVLTAKQIRHTQLLPQSWQFNGHVNANLDRADVKGVLKAKAGTSMNLDVAFPYRGSLVLEAKTRVSGESEAEALSRIFTAWPPLLLVSGGNVSANATLKKPQKGAMQLAGRLVFADWSGTYDRTVWSRMNGAAEFSLESERIKVDVPELTIEEVNPGLPVGPVRFVGGYEASIAQLASGELALETAHIGALGGDVNIQPGSWDLAQAPVTIAVELNQLSLARLLQLYPAEGLAGTGILSGTVPVLFDPATGIKIEQGRIDAVKPGGRLQVTAERLKALASQSESMKLVARALEDFRYSVLDSGIDYDEDGTLMLKLHLEGNSPEVGKGQPVVLNINLEENIPALLTSLQLSGRVSDAVAERVKKLLKNRERDSGDLLE